MRPQPWAPVDQVAVCAAAEQGLCAAGGTIRAPEAEILGRHTKTVLKE